MWTTVVFPPGLYEDAPQKNRNLKFSWQACFLNSIAQHEALLGIRIARLNGLEAITARVLGLLQVNQLHVCSPKMHVLSKH